MAKSKLTAKELKKRERTQRIIKALKEAEITGFRKAKHQDIEAIILKKYRECHLEQVYLKDKYWAGYNNGKIHSLGEVFYLLTGEDIHLPNEIEDRLGRRRDFKTIIKMCNFKIECYECMKRGAERKIVLPDVRGEV